MAGPTNLSPQLIGDAIRAGLREGRQPVEVSATEGSQQATVYRGNLAHYRRHAQTSLDQADYLQAAEKSWGSYTQTIKAIGADHLLRITHHASIIGVAGHLAELAANIDPESGIALRHGLSAARSLHQHFYENDLPNRIVVENVGDVGTAIDLLQELFPAEASAQ